MALLFTLTKSIWVNLILRVLTFLQKVKVLKLYPSVVCTVHLHKQPIYIQNLFSCFCAKRSGEKTYSSATQTDRQAHAHVFISAVQKYLLNSANPIMMFHSVREPVWNRRCHIWNSWINFLLALPNCQKICSSSTQTHTNVFKSGPLKPGTL